LLDLGSPHLGGDDFVNREERDRKKTEEENEAKGMKTVYKSICEEYARQSTSILNPSILAYFEGDDGRRQGTLGGQCFR
jgi:hypothetical protein